MGLQVGIEERKSPVIILLFLGSAFWGDSTMAEGLAKAPLRSLRALRSLRSLRSLCSPFAHQVSVQDPFMCLGMLSGRIYPEIYRLPVESTGRSTGRPGRSTGRSTGCPPTFPFLAKFYKKFLTFAGFW